MMVYRNSLKFGLLPVLLLCLLYPVESSGKMVVGVIFSGNIPYYRSMHVAFLEELKQKLPVEEDVKFVVQFPAPDPVAWSNSAKKLVVGGVDLIMSYGYPATNAVLSKDTDIPLVYVGVYDPESVIVNVGKVTGCGYRVPLSSLLRYGNQITQIDRLNVIYSPNEEDSIRQMDELARLAEKEKVSLVRMDFKSRGDLNKLDGLGKGDAVFITGSTVAHVMIKDIMASLRGKNIPAVDIFPDSSEDGVLVTLYLNPNEQGRSAAEIVAKIITGESVENVKPVIQTNTELVLNRIEAGKMGITFPPQLMSEATRVVE